jgi:hypothetical protein
MADVPRRWFSRAETVKINPFGLQLKHVSATFAKLQHFVAASRKR